MNRGWWVAAGVAAIVGLAAAGIYVLTPARSRPDLPVLVHVPDFTLTERSGRPISLSDLAGRVWVANFVFTHCTGPCPLLSAQMQELQGKLAGVEGVRLVSFSVDPERDTPEVLSAYAERFEADPDRWWFLTGEREAVYGLIRKGFKLGVQAGEAGQGMAGGTDPTGRADPMSGSHQILHTMRFVLVDGAGQVRGYYDGTDPELSASVVPAVKGLLATGG